MSAKSKAIYDGILRHPTYGDIEGALRSLTNDEIDALREDLADNGTDHFLLAHAGNILLKALRRYAKNASEGVDLAVDRAELKQIGNCD